MRRIRIDSVTAAELEDLSQELGRELYERAGLGRLVTDAGELVFYVRGVDGMVIVTPLRDAFEVTVTGLVWRIGKLPGDAPTVRLVLQHYGFELTPSGDAKATVDAADLPGLILNGFRAIRTVTDVPALLEAYAATHESESFKNECY